MKVLELGSYVAPAYAGMLLAEQGFDVVKWSTHDPIHSLAHGDRLWEWINYRKVVLEIHAREVLGLDKDDGINIVVDNYRDQTWKNWGIHPAAEADRLNVTWVSLRADDDGSSFDLIAQARAWGDSGILPFYLGDTAAGLWVAFKALASPPGHYVVRQATALAKLREGELTLPRPPGDTPWDAPGDYVWDASTRTARVRFRGREYIEPARDDHWRSVNLTNVNGRYVV